MGAGGSTQLSGAGRRGWKETTEPADASDGTDGSEAPAGAGGEVGYTYYGWVADAGWENKTRSNVKALHSIT